MNDTDLTLIIDLVAGHLSPAEERAAVARISADPELRSAYDAQRAVVERMHAAPAAAMTPSERDHLHANLKARLHLGDAASAPRAASRRNRWLAPLGGLAVAAVIVGAVVVLPDTFSNDPGTSLQVAAAASTTVPADTKLPEPAVTAAAAEATPLAAVPETTAPAPAPGEAADAPGTDETAAVPEVGVTEPLGIPYVPDLSLDKLAASYASDPHLIDDLTVRSSAERSNALDGAATTCLDTVATALPDATVRAVVITPVDGADALVVTVTPPGEDVYLTAYSLSACEPVWDTRG